MGRHAALRDFVADLLEREGAAVEPIEPDGLDVLAPEPLRAALGWPETGAARFRRNPARTARLPSVSKATGSTASARCSATAAACRAAAGGRSRQLVAPSDPERLLERALDLPNAVWRLATSAPAWTRCLLLAFRYTAISDEKRDGLVWLGFNQTTGARCRPSCCPGCGWRRWAVLGRSPSRSTPPPPASPGAPTAAGPGVAALLEQVRQELEPFLSAMRRRLDRDRDRIHAYHDDLRGAALAKLAALGKAKGSKADSERQREGMRVGAALRLPLLWRSRSRTCSWSSSAS